MDGYLSKPVDPTALFAAIEFGQAPIERRHADRRAAAAPPINVDELRRRLGGDEELMTEVTEMFLADCPARLADIKAAVASGNPGAIRTAAHALKGAAGNLSAIPVAECAGALERMAADGAVDPIAADAAHARLEAESARLVAALRGGFMAHEPSVQQ
jgi:HPt (histidine-containing phosphotransfer) domain-containing protein